MKLPGHRIVDNNGGGCILIYRIIKIFGANFILPVKTGPLQFIREKRARI